MASLGKPIGRTVATLMLALTIAALTPTGSAAAPSEVVVDARDALRDVRSLGPDGLSRQQEQSIDISDVKVIDRGRATRFQVKFRRITDSDRFDQMFFVTMRRPDSENVVGTVGMSPSTGARRYGYAYWQRARGFNGCDPLRATAAPKSDRAWLDVPDRCVPSGRVKLSTSSVTGWFRSDARAFSQDTFRVRGVYRLR